MHRDDLLADTRWVAFEAVMQLADRNEIVAGLEKTVAPAWYPSVIGGRVVPISGLVNMAAGSETGPRRRSDRRVGVGVGETGPSFRQRIEVGVPASGWP